MRSLLLLLTLAFGTAELSAQPFITVWKTDNPGSSEDNQIRIPADGTSYNYDIYWEDITNSEVNGTASGITGVHTITFPAAGTYKVEISGTFPQISFSNSIHGGDREKIIDISQWGSIAWVSMSGAFYRCTNLTMSATDLPNLAGVTSMSNMFYGATSFNGAIGNWNVSNVTTMGAAFYEAASFNNSLTSWDVSQVTSFAAMFYGASAFDQDLGSWNVGAATNFNSMFSGAASFNQDIGGWDVSHATKMTYMLEGAVLFDQDLSGWDVSNVKDMTGMFNGCSLFNQPIGGWDVSAVTDMKHMFNGATLFNQDITGWNVSGVTNMSGMFASAKTFNQDISGWDVANVVNISSMFQQATSFNQPIGTWNTGSAVYANSTFYGATAFNQDLSNWDMSHVTTAASMFSGASSFNGDIGNWDVSNVTLMRDMFSRSDFNGDISAWDVSKVEDMSHMFSFSAFNQNIGAWEVGNVSNMLWMFRQNRHFNQDIGGWDVSKVTDMGYMFYVADAFNQDISNWDVSNVTDMEEMLSSSGLSTENYDKVLTGWSSLPSLQSDVVFGASDISFCEAMESRQLLVDDFGWTIADAGQICSPTDIELDNQSVSENEEVGSLVGLLSVVDIDNRGVRRYYLSGQNASLFSIEDNQLLTAEVFNFEDTLAYEINITVEDSDGLKFSKVFVINIVDVNEDPFVLSAISDARGDTGFGEQTFNLVGVFEDPDGDVLTFSVAVADNAIVGTSLAGSVLTIFEKEMGNTDITITADDGHSGQVEMAFNFRVNTWPVVAGPIEDINILEGTPRSSILLTNFFSDVDADLLTFEASSNDESVVFVWAEGIYLNFTYNAPGSATVNVSADDGHGGTVETFFDYTMTALFSLENPIEDQLFQEGFDKAEINLTEVFKNNSGRDMFYDVSLSDVAVAEVNISGDVMKIQEIANGKTTVTLLATDRNGHSTPTDFVLTINSSPIVVVPLEDHAEAEGVGTVSYDISETFADMDGDMLIYSVESSKEEVAVAFIEGELLTIKEIGNGFSFITVTAGDGKGATVSEVFTFEILKNRLLAAKSLDLGASFVLYPNPVSKIVNLTGSLINQNSGISITDLSGRSYAVDVIYKDGEIQLDVSELSKGVYVLILDLDGRPQAKKFIKE
ncbi:BspA family leucine-rich repeat surface protein [Imperialibacter roseus]|uniref:BspA family leucine-rich repeat surface protein n=1 Tax=Imperialibacter roseus TaxID=1324217 RepID=A0ABZ0IPL6_9BACT|nr:BspA family leucine-rich repeat surface protein [Imperialibacter roseus]WOK06398.1 BspA family leucine-rich repeat surface protein [Imperialibacter roseus]